MLRPLLILLTLAVAAPVAAEQLPRELEGVDVDEKFGEQVDLSLTFTDHEGQTRPLSHWVRGDVPVLLTLNYYGCPLLCGLQLNALSDALKTFDWSPGENYRIVTVSFDPSEGPELARAKRDAYLEDLGKGDVDWSFLVGSDENVRALASQVGFGYRYVETQQEYAHPAAMMMLTPSGVVSRYLYGLTYSALDLRLATVEAGEGRIGTPVDHFVLACFVYDPRAGSYVKDAMMLMRLGGLTTMIALGLLLFTLWRRESLRPLPDPV